MTRFCHFLFTPYRLRPYKLRISWIFSELRKKQNNKNNKCLYKKDRKLNKSQLQTNLDFLSYKVFLIYQKLSKKSSLFWVQLVMQFVSPTQYSTDFQYFSLQSYWNLIAIVWKNVYLKYIEHSLTSTSCLTHLKTAYKTAYSVTYF